MGPEDTIRRFCDAISAHDGDGAAALADPSIVIVIGSNELEASKRFEQWPASAPRVSTRTSKFSASTAPTDATRSRPAAFSAGRRPASSRSIRSWASWSTSTTGASWRGPRCGRRATDGSVRVQDCNWMQLEDYLRRDDRIVLPLGSTEQHAYLSLATDNILAERVSVEAAGPRGAPVLPGQPSGITPRFAAYPGSPTLRVETFLAVVTDLLDSLSGQGFGRILIVHGHRGAPHARA